MQAAQLVQIVARLRWHPARRLTAWLGGDLSASRSNMLRWRTRSRQRLELFRAPSSVRRELLARGIDVEFEINKPFWRP